MAREFYPAIESFLDIFVDWSIYKGGLSPPLLLFLWNKDRIALNRKFGAGGGGRTLTRGEPHGILSPARLPVSPLRPVCVGRKP